MPFNELGLGGSEIVRLVQRRQAHLFIDIVHRQLPRPWPGLWSVFRLRRTGARHLPALLMAIPLFALQALPFVAAMALMVVLLAIFSGLATWLPRILTW